MATDQSSASPPSPTTSSPVDTASPSLPPLSSTPISNNDTLISINVSAQAPIKLTAANYPLWHSQWYSLLIGYNLMGYVDGSKICPSDLDASLSSAAIHCLRQDHLLRSSLLASLTPEIANFVSIFHLSSCSLHSSTTTIFLILAC